MKKLTTLIIAVIVAATAAICAQEGSSSKGSDVRRLLGLMQVEQNMKMAMHNSMKAMRPMMRKAYPSVSDAQWQEFVDFATSKSQTKKLIDVAAESWSKHFSHSEIKKLVEFYESPVGRKLVRVQPRMMREISSAVESCAIETAKEFSQKLEQQSTQY